LECRKNIRKLQTAEQPDFLPRTSGLEIAIGRSIPVETSRDKVQKKCRTDETAASLI
jgi:hypothetical protein